jgi:hypothetical protein
MAMIAKGMTCEAKYILASQVIPFAIIAIYFAKVNSWNSAFETNPGVLYTRIRFKCGVPGVHFRKVDGDDSERDDL